MPVELKRPDWFVATTAPISKIHTMLCMHALLFRESKVHDILAKFQLPVNLMYHLFITESTGLKLV